MDAIGILLLSFFFVIIFAIACNDYLLVDFIRSYGLQVLKASKHPVLLNLLHPNACWMYESLTTTTTKKEGRRVNRYVHGWKVMVDCLHSVTVLVLTHIAWRGVSLQWLCFTFTIVALIFINIPSLRANT